MRVKPFDDDDGMRCWLHPKEVDLLISEMGTDTRKSIAALLAARCGLRRREIVGIQPNDIVRTRIGPSVRVRAAIEKNNRRRTSPVPNQLRDYISAFADASDLDDDEPVIGRTHKTVYRWVRDAAESLRERTENEDWQHVTPHDLRRTWATALLEDGCLPTVVMDWGGWESWETFRQHYIGEFSPRALQRERSKVGYLSDQVDVDDAGEQNEAYVVPVETTNHASGD